MGSSFKSRRTRSTVDKAERFSLSKATHLSCLGPCFNTSFWFSLLEYMAVTRDDLGSGTSPTFANSSTFESTLNLALACTPHKRRQNVQICTTQIVKLQPTLDRGHYTFNCKAAAVPYRTRLSRTQMLENPDKFSGVPGGKRQGAECGSPRVRAVTGVRV